MRSIEEHHRIPGGGAGVVEGNVFRRDIEEAARLLGFDAVVNVVLNSRRQIAGLVVGDLVAAHRAGVKIAERVYATGVPTGMDIVITNAYPLDTELFQAVKGLWPGYRASRLAVLLASCREGLGFHAIYQKRGFHWRDPNSPESPWSGERRLIVFSPNLSSKEVYQLFPRDGTTLLKTWREVEDALKEGRRAAVFPCASIQVPAA